MPINFPDAPINGQSFGTAPVWTYDGEKWRATTPGITSIAYLPLTGGTLSGGLIIQPSSGGWAQLGFKSTANNANQIVGYRDDTPRWELKLTGDDAETGGNAGSNFYLNAFADNGTWLGTTLTIIRASGQVYLNYGLVVSGSFKTGQDSGSSLRLGRWSPAFGGAVISFEDTTGGSNHPGFCSFQFGSIEKARLFSSGNLQLQGQLLNFCGNSGDPWSGGGPLIYADTANFVFKTGVSNFGWLFWDYNTRQVALLRSGGTFETYGNTSDTQITIIAAANGDSRFKLYSANNRYDWQIVGQGSYRPGELWFYNGKTGALPFYIEQGGNSVFQYDVVVQNARSIYVGRPGDGCGGVRLQSGDIYAAGYIGIHNPDGTRLCFFGYYTDKPQIQIERGGEFVINGGSLQVWGAIKSGSANAILNFSDRTSGQMWGWYSHDSVARLWYGPAGDKCYYNATNDQFVTPGAIVSGSGYIYGQAYQLLGRVLFNGDGSSYVGLWHQSGVVFMQIVANSTTYYDNARHQFRDYNAGTTWCYFDQGGCWNSTGYWGNFSDRSVKRDIKPYERGLESIAALRPVSYKYNDDTPFADGCVHYGIIAQELEEVLPELVSEVNLYKYGTIKATHPGQLIFACINAIRELKERLDTVSSELSGLKNRDH